MKTCNKRLRSGNRNEPEKYSEKKYYYEKRETPLFGFPPLFYVLPIIMEKSDSFLESIFFV